MLEQEAAKDMRQAAAAAITSIRQNDPSEIVEEHLRAHRKAEFDFDLARFIAEKILAQQEQRVFSAEDSFKLPEDEQDHPVLKKMKNSLTRPDEKQNKIRLHPQRLTTTKSTTTEAASATTGKYSIKRLAIPRG